MDNKERLPITEVVERAERLVPKLRSSGEVNESIEPRKLPRWASAFGAFRRGSLIIVLCVDGGAGSLDALILDVPQGRYSVTTIDEKTGDVVGIESAGGGPLVCTPPRTAQASVVVIERIV